MVVPTAAMRPPRVMHRVQPRRGRARPARARSACMRCCAVSSAVTGRKVPSPTCRVTVSRATPLRVQRREQLRREMQARGGRGHRAFLPRETGSDSRTRRAHRPCACRRYRAAAASRPARRWPHPARRPTGQSEFPPRHFRPAPRPRAFKRAEQQRVAHRQLARRPRQHANSGRPQGAGAAGFRSWRDRPRAAAGHTAAPGSPWCR